MSTDDGGTNTTFAGPPELPTDDTDQFVQLPHDELPESGRLVAESLARDGEAAPVELAERLGVPPSRVHTGLDQLGDAVESRPCLTDTRMVIYSLREGQQ